MRSHLRSPDEMNWSITTCAPLAKSPNCASHKTSVSGSAVAKPYSKAITASSDSSESMTSTDVPSRTCASGVAMEERAAAGILADQAQRVAFGHQRCVGHVLGVAPIERCVALGHLAAVGIDLGDTRLQRHAFRPRQDFGC